jgi:hypothetical protein
MAAGSHFTVPLALSHGPGGGTVAPAAAAGDLHAQLARSTVTVTGRSLSGTQSMPA